MKFLIVITMLLTVTLSQAAALPRMFFHCSGHDKQNISVQLGTNSYVHGAMQGLNLQIRGFFNDYNDEKLKDDNIVITKNAKYTPRNPKYAGLEKYEINTKEYTHISLMIPSRAVLEKQWSTIQDRYPQKSNNFKAYVQLQYSSGDSFTLMELNCGLNWKNVTR